MHTKEDQEDLLKHEFLIKWTSLKRVSAQMNAVIASNQGTIEHGVQKIRADLQFGEGRLYYFVLCIRHIFCVIVYHI